MPPPNPYVVFVHGIYSDGPSAFGEMLKSFVSDTRFNGWSFEYFNYMFHRPLQENAARLVDRLSQIGQDRNIILICHSMGGLIGRLAILSGKISCVTKLIMLGTPNFGAVRTGSLGILAQVGLRTVGTFYGHYFSPGVWQLTQVNKIFQDPLRTGTDHANAVQYVTIPGLFFHSERGVLDLGDREEEKRDEALWTKFFTSINIGSEVMDAFLPLWKIGLKKPHDGIVEAESNSLIPCTAGRLSEKCASIRSASATGYTYAHIEHDVCGELIHTMIQKNHLIIELVKRLLHNRELDLVSWYHSLPRDIKGHINFEYKTQD